MNSIIIIQLILVLEYLYAVLYMSQIPVIWTRSEINLLLSQINKADDEELASIIHSAIHSWRNLDFKTGASTHP